MSKETEHKPGFPVTLPKGFVGSLNGVEVEFDENLHFRILAAATVDQAVEFAHIHKLPIDLSEPQFSFFDEEKGVFVTFSGKDGARVEETPQEKEEREAAVEASRAEALATEEAEGDDEKPKGKKKAN